MWPWLGRQSKFTKFVFDVRSRAFLAKRVECCLFFVCSRFFSNEESNTACSSCAADSFSNSVFTACVSCPVGQIKTASAQCEKCEVGTYSDLEGTKCLTCARGFTEVSGVTKCTDISPGAKLSPSKVAACMILPAILSSLVQYS